MKEFRNILDFAVHLASAAVAVRVAEHHALDRAAQIIGKDAKARLDIIGTLNVKNTITGRRLRVN